MVAVALRDSKVRAAKRGRGGKGSCLAGALSNILSNFAALKPSKCDTCKLVALVLLQSCPLLPVMCTRL